MARAAPTCDTPGCGAERQPHLLFCDSCWQRTPLEIRAAVLVAIDTRQTVAWSQALVFARNWHRSHPVIVAAPIAEPAHV